RHCSSRYRFFKSIAVACKFGSCRGSAFTYTDNTPSLSVRRERAQRLSWSSHSIATTIHHLFLRRPVGRQCCLPTVCSYQHLVSSLAVVTTRCGRDQAGS